MYTRFLRKLNSFLKLVKNGHCSDGGSGHCSDEGDKDKGGGSGHCT